MYLVIAKNKHGLSIDNPYPTEEKAQIRCQELNDNFNENFEFFVRKFDLASIDLEKLMGEGER
jgi:hypothetical protein